MAFVVVVSGLMVVVAGFMVRSALDHAHSILVCRGLRILFVVLAELAVVPVETDAPQNSAKYAGPDQCSAGSHQIVAMLCGFSTRRELHQAHHQYYDP